MVTLAIYERLKALSGAAGAGSALQNEVAELFSQTRDDVYRYLLTVGLHPPQAQETTQEVFLRYYISRKRGEEIRSPRGWVFRVAHNLGLKIRSRQSRQLPFDIDIEAKLEGSHPDPEQSLIERERLLRLHRAIQGLSEQQRRCLFLRLEGLRYPEIGAVLGIGASTVGEFLRRAITRLRKATHE